MINYIKGSLDFIGEGFIIIENNGIGYSISVSSKTQSNLVKQGMELKIFTYMNVKEDEISLFGFLSIEELNMFKQLITVSGVGPKSALSLLSALSPSKIALAIITSDINTLSCGQGIGKKIAQRISLELKDKIKTEDAVDLMPLGESGDNLLAMPENDERSEAIEALVSLGFSRSQAVKAVSEVYLNGMSSSVLISKALKKLS